MGSLSGKVAIVTGGGQGIGKAESILLAAEGASVIVNDLGGLEGGKDTPQSFANQVVAQIRAAGGEAEANFADVADWESAKGLVDQAVRAFGRLDILLCNAGIVRDRMTHKMSEAEWDDVIRVHLKGHFAPTRHAITYWRELAKTTGTAVNARVIYTTSEAGMFGNLGQPNYSAAKAGIMGLCFEVAKEVQRFGVTVNTISPRARTPMTEGTFGAFNAKKVSSILGIPKTSPPGRSSLARDEAANISGQIFIVFGGTVQVMTPWPVAAQISAERRWTPQELVTQARNLFPDLRADPPPFPDVGIPN